MPSPMKGPGGGSKSNKMASFCTTSAPDDKSFFDGLLEKKEQLAGNFDDSIALQTAYLRGGAAVGGGTGGVKNRKGSEARSQINDDDKSENKTYNKGLNYFYPGAPKTTTSTKTSQQP